MNAQEPSISVVMPVFNPGELVRDTIKSVLSQTWADFEFIIIDDGSFPDTADIIRTFHDPRIQYHHQENRGMAAARNRGIALARGTFIAFLDHDDIWLPEKLERQRELMQDHPQVGLAYSPVILFDNSGKQWNPHVAPVSGFAFYRLLASNFIRSASCVMIRKEAVEHIDEPFRDECKPCDDWQLWLSIASLREIRNTAEPLVLYRIHDRNVSRNQEAMYHAGIAVLHRFRSNLSILHSKGGIGKFRFLVHYHYGLSRHYRGLAFLAIYRHETGKFLKYNVMAFLHNMFEYRNWLLWLRLFKELLRHDDRTRR